MGDTTAEIARRRGTNSAVLFRQLEGDLDWIVLKALEKDRNRRYPSVSGLAADVRRHLTDQPVVARPPSASYRIGKFVRRHRIGVSAAALAGLALLVGSTLATIGLIRASRAEEEARLEAETANQVTEFLIELYQVSDPSEARGSSVTARELLDKGAERIRRELEGQPLVRTRLLFAIGRVYQALGLYPQARDLMDLSLDSASAADPEGVNVHPILLALGRLARQQGRTDDAFEFARESEALTESRFGARSAERAASLQLLGELYRDDADYDEAERLLNEALNISEEASGPDHITVGWILYHLGWLHQLRAEYEEALPVYDRALRIAERNLTEEDPLFGYFLNDVGTLHSALGDYAAAEESYRRALAVREIALEELHPAIADTLNNIGSALWFQGKMAEAEDHYRRALEIRREALGPEHPQVAGSLNNLALVYRSVGNLEDARPLYEEALEIREATAGPDHPDTAGVLSNLGGLLARVGDYDEAESMLNRALAINEATFGATHPDVGNVLVQLSFLHSRRGALVEARRATERALEIRESALGPNHTEVASLLTTLGALTSSGEPVQRAIGIYEDTGSDQVAAALWELAWLNESQGNPEAAKESADRAQEYLLDVQGESAAGWAYDSARTDGLAGFSDLALYKLRQAVELGFSATGVAEDEAFATLVGRPEFEDVAAVLAGRVRP